MVSLTEKYKDYFTFKPSPSPSPAEASDQKFGMFVGVFVPCLLMLFGVIIFLRLGWIVGQVGLPTTLFIISMSALITFISTLSMASISTNIQVGKGGVYYIISRSLGIEVGSAVGIPLYLKQALSIAFCCVGFAESLHDLVPSWSITSIGLTTLCVLTFLAYTSVKGALKVQVAIFIILVASFISLFTGSEVQPMHPDTFTPSYVRHGFWAVFAIFFPAMTGVESIVSLSGDLKNPSRSIPVGTIAASIVSFLAYTSIAIFLAWNVPLDRLATDPLILQDVASIPSLIILGIWGATLSSALGGLLSAPRTLQAISDDGILPKFLGRTFGPMSEPRIATLVTFTLSFFGIYFGSINIIAPVMTMICLVSYGVLNFSSGFETVMSNPSWRPLFKVHWLISIIGAVLCLLTMLMIDAGVAILSLIGVIAIYVTVKKKKFKGSWDDIRHGIFMFVARLAVHQLASGPSAFKSWRPHFLVFTKSSEEYSRNLLSFTEGISQSRSFLTVSTVVPSTKIKAEKRSHFSEMIAKKLKNKNINAFVNISEGTDPLYEMRSMLKYYGLGPLKPNTVIFGGITNGEEVSDFADTIKCAIKEKYNIVIVNDESNLDAFKENAPESQEIHVWWDDADDHTSELMLVFAFMIQRNPHLKKSRINLKAIVGDERGRKGRMNYFKELSKRLRLPLDVDIYVSPNPEKETLSFVNSFSSEADMVFVSLKKPGKKSDEEEPYTEYLKRMSRLTDQNSSVILVASSEHTPLGAILK